MLRFVLLTFIYWIVIYPVDSILHSLNNWAQNTTPYLCKEREQSALHSAYHLHIYKIIGISL